ncbi:MAG: hypothetical protein K9L17_14315 [Clostridiales bacterium]|nr:hypothetical protein [Clostridiales bacterium]MCF8023844.1 hypothetical protein [Clostridiales bacterium]
MRYFKGKKGKRFDLWLPEDHPFFNIPAGERSRWLRNIIEEKMDIKDTTHKTFSTTTPVAANSLEIKPSEPLVVEKKSCFNREKIKPKGKNHKALLEF